MGVVFIVLAVFVVGVGYYYNTLIQGRIHVKEGWSGIDVQLKRRHDLISNLIEVVKGYAQHEREVLENVIRLRAQSTGEGGVKAKAVLENGITNALKTLFAVVEAYPDLKANQNFIDLSNGLTEIEDEIQLARRYYNGTVRNYNIKVQSFPGNIIAGFFRFAAAEFFEIEISTQRAAPKVQL